KTGVKLEPLGLVAVADGFHQQAAGLSHPESRETVQNGEGLFAHDAVEPSLCVGVRAGAVVGQRVAQDPSRLALLVVDVAQAFERGGRARNRIQAVIVLKLTGEFLFQRAARVGDEALEAVTGGLIKRHPYSSLPKLNETSISS